MFSASKTAAPVSGSFQVSNSLRFRQSASAYLSKTLTLSATWTLSLWIKRGKLGVTSPIFGSSIAFNSNDTLTAGTLTTTAVYRDPSSWYHIVVSNSGCYVNGVSVGSVTTGILVNPSIGNYLTNYFDGYMAEVNFIDGQALTPSSFGSTNATTGVWQPARYTGSYGTNGFYLKFNNGTSTTTLGNDSSGNNNNWTTNNISLTAGSTYDWMIDSPTSYAGSSYGVGNYAVLNAVASDGTVSNANLTVAWSGGNSAKPATIGMSSGKWYCEIYIDTVGTAALPGIIPSTMTPSAGYPGSGSGGYGYYYDGQKYTSGAGSAYGASYTTGNIISIAFDADSGSLTFYKNGVSQGVAFSSIPAGTWFFAAGHSGTCTMSPNFGQRPFAYTPPTGYKTLCTQNLPAPTIYNGANHMAATTYTGTGSSLSISNSVNSASFQPDLVWIKSRSAATDHALYDVIRGTQNRLESNTTDAAVAADNGLTAFGSSGFTVNTLAQVNTSAATYVGWQWKAGGTAVTNNIGSITSQVSANTTAGFSVVTYTGTGANATVGHGLGVAPSMVIIKGRNLVVNWGIYHVSLGNQYIMQFEAAAAYGPSSSYFNSTSPSSTVFSIGTLGNVNGSTNTFVAYCFAAIAGYSAFGSFSGNASTDGPFVYCGFQPKFVLVKCSSTTGNWYVFDSVRNTYNVLGEQLYPNLSNAGSTVTTLDFLSNGFKMRIATDPNASATYIYAAFASSPFQNSLAF